MRSFYQDDFHFVPVYLEFVPRYFSTKVFDTGLDIGAPFCLPTTEQRTTSPPLESRELGSRDEGGGRGVYCCAAVDVLWDA